MIGQKAIAKALPGFNDPGRSVTPINKKRKKKEGHYRPQIE